MSALSKGLVVAGGAAITAALLWWWIKEHPTTPKCEDYRTSSDCTSHGCYWYDGSCHSYPQHAPEVHYECIKDSYSGLIVCSIVAGAGTDQCDPFGEPDACWAKLPCTSNVECGYGARCWEGKCYWNANEYLDWEGDTINIVRVMFDKRVVGNKLLGDVTFTLAPWKFYCSPHLRIYLIRGGKRVRTIYDKYHEGMGATHGDPQVRTDTIAVFIAAEAADGIEFEGACEWWGGAPEVLLSDIHCQFLFI